MTVVERLDLDDNNLRGSLPASVRALPHLKALNIARNHLSGSVPEELLQRWDTNQFEFDGSGNTFSNLIVRAKVEWTAGGVLCAENEDVRYSVELDESTGRALFQSIRCRKGSRRTYCLVREGRAPSLTRLSRALASLGFSKFLSEYDYAFIGKTHGLSLTTTAVWGDKSSKAVESYDRQGPIQVWVAQELFLSLTPAEWEREFEKPKCEGVR